MHYASEGILYVIATPIGHLKDLGHRAEEVLKKVDLILSEDTRETDKLLKAYKIKKPQIPYNDKGHQKTIEHIIEQLDQNKKLALLSDSGTPLISDPGFKLVRRLRKENYQVTAIPGPSSPVAALSVSGLPTDSFTFIGFLPKANKKREQILIDHKISQQTLIFLVSPYRINQQLKEFFKILGNRTACVAKDLTKKFERVEVSELSELVNEEFPQKGEYVVLIAKEGYTL